MKFKCNPFTFLVTSTTAARLLFPPILQHYVLNRAHRGYNENNIKYWKFSDIFEYKDNNMNVLELIENKHILKLSNNQYFIRQNDITNPLNFYGFSKLGGEFAVKTHCKKYIILRVVCRHGMKIFIYLKIIYNIIT